MKEIKNDIIAKYQYKDYVIYIKETKNEYEYYVQNERYAVSYMMYGIDKNLYKLDTLLTIIKNNIESDIQFYKDHYED